MTNASRSAGWSFRQDHWIVPTLGKRMATQQPPQNFPCAPPGPVVIDYFHGVFGAGGHKSAGIREQGRKHRLVSAQGKQNKRANHFSSSLLLGLKFASRPTFLCITSKARFTSWSIWENSAVSTSFLGLKITSTE